MKKITMILSILFFVFLAACSSDEATPQDRFATYVKQWNDQKFNEMHDMLSAKSAEKYSTEQFVDRYKKIYKDLGISDLKVSFKKLGEEKLESAMDKGKATFPITVKMNTIAGPISFDYKATLVKEGEDDKENWFVQWDPGFIFPEIKDGGEIGIQTEVPKRGEILDRNKMPLAINDIAYEIGIIPEKLGDNPEAMKKKIAGLLDMSVDGIDAALNADWVEPNLFVPLKKVPKTKEAVLNQLWELDPVTEREVTGRVYPAGEAAAHLVGYVGKITAEELEKQEPGEYTANDTIGKRGLEQLYEDQLKGEQGVTITVSKEGEDDVVLAEKPVKDGENIQTTIDVDLQEKIYSSYDGEAGTTAAVNPKTGETLALVSSPAFNPNKMLYGVSQSELGKLQDDPQKPMINRFSATFAPGSVMKPITAAAGLNNGSIDPDKGIEINGLDWSNGKGWGDYKVHRVSSSDGPVDLTDALVRSDNIYFAMKAVDMGAEAFAKGLKQFGFGEDVPFEYPIETSTISESGKFADEVQLADSSYGQGQIQMSPLHLAMAYTSFLNDGKMLKPVLLGNEKTGQTWKEGLVTSDQANVIKDALRKVVDSPKGTAKGAKNADFAISGKTGTAELKKTADDKSGQENGWFVAYPTEEQDILIAMMIEHTEYKGGSSYAVKKVTNILKDFHK
ncbi:penicillin-binding transpeptidase domain-containing protein [Virgibacillus dakarensis]|uniref:serine-type D-Ala-D-Ala carboxypeptidase n=1 Tax=Lentibacillus populi TaxID=1827502 RepID=A0A9W5U0A6_9BACI|nr:penicillin-binding transpeptidase domain-containing protein [Lentibacillus populi]MTW87644.1 penicillin-binding transpeptidase domain-containing protein [Virgibacillus dakarensis]GGB55145.1 penicillin-binding protein 3 [Lentibacillus populi]